MKFLFFLLCLFFCAQSFSEEIVIVPEGGTVTVYKSFSLSDQFGVTVIMHGQTLFKLTEGMEYTVSQEFFSPTNTLVLGVEVLSAGQVFNGIIIKKGAKVCSASPNSQLSSSECDEHLKATTH